jgi:hypothetical protein
MAASSPPAAISSAAASQYGNAGRLPPASRAIAPNND